MTAWQWTALALAAVCAVAAAVALLVGRGGRIPASRAARFARVGRMLAGLSASWLGSRLRRLFAGRERRERIDSAAREANARRLAETMGNMIVSKRRACTISVVSTRGVQ